MMLITVTAQILGTQDFQAHEDFSWFNKTCNKLKHDYKRAKRANKFKCISYL